MRYTQSQVRGLISISVDDFKTWRKLISALAAHKGHGPTFTPGDVVALAIVAELVRDFGIRVGTIAAQLDRLFADCHGRSWVSLESCVVLLKVDEVQLTDEAAAQGRLSEQTTIAVPCGRIIARLQSALTDSEADTAQGYLHFPPTSLTGALERSGKRA
ncbi:MAG: hypothetical protein A4S12_09985 [Proteobacteria bacterium SG_bin5]|nr:MAG: hypothetical protein A4S12_09985 [Proteobacteria bacterium SG_bin5]